MPPLTELLLWVGLHLRWQFWSSQLLQTPSPVSIAVGAFAQDFATASPSWCVPTAEIPGPDAAG